VIGLFNTEYSPTLQSVFKANMLVEGAYTCIDKIKQALYYEKYSKFNIEIIKIW
jgi:hypothetical protein